MKYKFTIGKLKTFTSSPLIEKPATTFAKEHSSRSSQLAVTHSAILLSVKQRSDVVILTHICHI